MTTPKRGEGAAARFGKVEGLTLAHYVLVRDLHLRELVVIETKWCDICDLNREIVYYGNYDGFAECFNVCELCGKELIENSAAIIKSLEASSPSALIAAVEARIKVLVASITAKYDAGYRYGALVGVTEKENFELDILCRYFPELTPEWSKIRPSLANANLLRSPPTEAAER